MNNVLIYNSLLMFAQESDNIVHIIDGIEHQIGIKDGLLQ